MYIIPLTWKYEIIKYGNEKITIRQTVNEPAEIQLTVGDHQETPVTTVLCYDVSEIKKDPNSGFQILVQSVSTPIASSQNRTIGTIGVCIN